MTALAERVSQVVMQPTTLCNLDCKYCYLPNRRVRLRMRADVAAAVAADLPLGNRPLPISWHAGEPLATGIDAFASLLSPFSSLRQAGRIQHVIQTNATLITDNWIDLLEEHGFVVGLSIDGNETLNGRRVDWSGRESFRRTMNGIDLLRQRCMPFHAIAVVGESALADAPTFFRFFADLGCESLRN